VLLPGSQPIWALPLKQDYPGLRTPPEGINQLEAKQRLKHEGANRLPPLKRGSLALRFLDQIVHLMDLLLWTQGLWHTSREHRNGAGDLGGGSDQRCFLVLVGVPSVSNPGCLLMAPIELLERRR
jgi:hypothetical protein